MSLKVESDKTPKQNKLLDFDDVTKAAIVIKALKNPIRKRLIAYLSKNEAATVTNIGLNLREEHKKISQHLNILRKAKIVYFLKKGKNVHYFLNQARMAEIQKSFVILLDEISDEDLLKIEKS